MLNHRAALEYTRSGDGFDAAVRQHENGTWLSSCPFCGKAIRAQTADGLDPLIVDHLNAVYPCTNPLLEATWVGNLRPRGSGL